MAGSRKLIQISALSREFVRFEVTAREGDNTLVDPTSWGVEAAFPAKGVDPVAGDWKLASWEPGGPRYYMRCLVGPGGGVVTLVAGEYDAWTRITTGTEEVIEKVGILKVT